MLGQLFNSRVGDGGISSFQAFCVGLASRVGRQHRRCRDRADRRWTRRDLLDVDGGLIGMATALIEATFESSGARR